MIASVYDFQQKLCVTILGYSVSVLYSWLRCNLLVVFTPVTCSIKFPSSTLLKWEKEAKNERKESELSIFSCASKLITWNKSFEYSLHGGGCKHFHAWSRPAAERSALSIHPAALLWIDNPKLAGGRGEEVLIERLRKQLSFPGRGGGSFLVPVWLMNCKVNMWHVAA